MMSDPAGRKSKSRMCLNGAGARLNKDTPSQSIYINHWSGNRLPKQD